MKLHIHNTLTRQKEEFVPIDAKNVRLYNCGPTVWNYAHIGNAKPAVIFDLLARVLEHLYGADHVSYSRNITDIDDKIIEASKQTGEPIKAITEKYARIYNEDMGALGVRPPTHQPKATEYIPQMIEMVDKLIKAGHAYAAEGHVLFDVPSWPDYGQLSRRNRDDMIAGARVEVAPYKKSPEDFILWKPSSDDQPGWDSTWGRGRPGWHLECSAMNAAIHGEHFDIHAGGEDLIFPHHENEIAQSTCAHGGKKYVNYWMHVGFVNMDNEKMSKSLGNIRLVHDLVKEFPAEALRLVLLSGHYRQPLNFTRDAVESAKKTLDRYYTMLRGKDVAEKSVPENFVAALLDDLNTPKALAELAQMDDLGDLKAAGKLIGLLQQDPEHWFKSDAGDHAAVIEERITALQDARAAKDFATADKIRDELKTQYGVVISVTKDGVSWRKE